MPSVRVPKEAPLEVTLTHSIPEEECDESFFVRSLHKIKNEINRKKTIIKQISRECTEVNIREKYCNMEVKHITYDPKLYSVVATEALGIHRRLLNVFGSDVIRLQDPNFIEHSLRVMLEQEENAEREATAARKRRGLECEWNAERKVRFQEEIQKLLNISPIEETQRPATSKKTHHDTKTKVRREVMQSAPYKHKEHEFEIVKSKYNVSKAIWEEEEETLTHNDIPLLFESAESTVQESHMPKHQFQMKRSGQSLKLIDASENEETMKTEIFLTKKPTITNSIDSKAIDSNASNSKRSGLHKKYRKATSMSSAQKSVSERTSSYIHSAKKSKLKTTKVVLSDIDEDDRSTFKPLKVKPEEKKLTKPTVDSQ